MSYNPHPTWPGFWVIDYYPQGRRGPRVRENIEATDEEAKAYERKVRGLHISQCHSTVNPPFKAIASDFVTWINTNRSATYAKSVGWTLNNLNPHFGILPPSRITDPLIEQYKEKRKHVTRACNQELEMLSIIINWGANPKRNYCRKLPFKIEKLPYEKPLPRVPSHASFEAFIAQQKDPLKKALCLIMYWSGPRFNDIVKARWEDADLKAKILVSRVKRGKEKVILLPDAAIAVLRKFQRPEGYIFENPRTGLPYTHIKRSFKTAWERAGIPKIKGPHTLRHACGKNTLDTTGDLRLTQEMLGHTQVRTTQIYTQVAVDRLKAAMRLTQKRLDRVDKKKREKCKQNE